MFSACRWGTAQAPGNSHTSRIASIRVLVPTFIHGYVLKDFPAKSLHLFVDGKQQKIQSVDKITPTPNGVRWDNMGEHLETALNPQGVWSTIDQDPNKFNNFFLVDSYVIAFTPPPSPEGSCHRIEIKAPKYQSLLIYRREYCNVPHSSTDPLRGTPEGAKLERYISSGKKGKIHISAEASYVYIAPGEACVQVDMEFPYRSAPPYDVLIIAYKKNGEVMARRSNHWRVIDTNRERADCDYTYRYYCQELAVDPWRVPTRYDAQMELPPGNYRIAIAFRRGSKFGVTEVPLRIRRYDPKQLSVSSIALCKRVGPAFKQPLVGFVPLVSKGYQFTPAADPVFREDTSLMAYFEVYEPAFGGPQRSAVSVHFAMRIINEKTGAVVLKKVLSAASYRVLGKSTIPIAVQPVLRSLHLTPGKYKFEIQACDSAGRKTPWEEVEFSYKRGKVGTPRIF